MLCVRACLLLLLLSPSQLLEGQSRYSPALCAGPRPLSAQQEDATKSKLLLRVVDENHVAVPGARVSLVEEQTGSRAERSSDHSGYCRFSGAEGASFSVRVEKEGFYIFRERGLGIGQLGNLEITLNHVQEFSERVDVVSSGPGISASATTSERTLGSQEIVNLPYPSTRDFRNSLPLIPGVLKDQAGQIHLNGSASSQTLSQIDGFNITQPADGLLHLRLSGDAFRSIEALGSRYSAQYGKGSGGVLNLETAMGDDRYRLSATNFIPSFQARSGLHIGNWTPRATFSGPIVRQKAWFFDAVQAEYDLNIVEELPPGANRSRIWRMSNLAKVQVNLTPAHLLSATFLVNEFDSKFADLTPLDPIETTTDQDSHISLFTIKDQSLLSNQTFLEIGLGYHTYDAGEQPQGEELYTIRPGQTEGNFYRSQEIYTRRLQGFGRMTLPPMQWRGRHIITFGMSLDSIIYRQSALRRPILVLRGDGTRARMSYFTPSPGFTRNNLEASSFLEDRWAPLDRLQLELGLRLDWDKIISDLLVSPRAAMSYVLPDGLTKLSAGAGLFYDATPLNLITAPADGSRFDVFYEADGLTVDKSATTSFRVAEDGLKQPRSLNWSLGIQRKLSDSFYLSGDFIQKRGENGLVFTWLSNDPFRGGLLKLENRRRDRVKSFQLTLRRSSQDNSEFLASYTWSTARTNEVLDFTIDNPVFGLQGRGPVNWDSPHRLLVWGWYPIPFLRGILAAYTLDWRTGFPFNLVNENQELVGPPHVQRFPTYFNLNVHFEKRFRFAGYQWAFRAGFNNLTGRPNATVVDNNVDSPNFLTYSAVQGRALTGRIRFLGNK